jgi:hypothetical protein
MTSPEWPPFHNLRAWQAQRRNDRVTRWRDSGRMCLDGRTGRLVGTPMSLT